MKQIITALLGWVVLPGTIELAQKPLGDVKAGDGDVWRCLSTAASLKSGSGLSILTLSLLPRVQELFKSRAVLYSLNSALKGTRDRSMPGRLLQGCRAGSCDFFRAL